MTSRLPDREALPFSRTVKRTEVEETLNKGLLLLPKISPDISRVEPGVLVPIPILLLVPST